jgi:hypothetical protein
MNNAVRRHSPPAYGSRSLAPSNGASDILCYMLLVDQAQEVHRNIEHFREPPLCHAAGEANLARGGAQ